MAVTKGREAWLLHRGGREAWLLQRGGGGEGTMRHGYN